MAGGGSAATVPGAAGGAAATVGRATFIVSSSDSSPSVSLTRSAFTSATSIPLIDISDTDAKKLPRYPVIPAALIGRLAIDQRFKGMRLGGALIIDAAKRAATSDAAIFAMIVEAKEETAKAFYEHLGFVCFRSKPMSLYLPLATLLNVT